VLSASCRLNAHWLQRGAVKGILMHNTGTAVSVPAVDSDSTQMTPPPTTATSR
jgi:hypothetical protein